jgi:hypothetical protein
MTILKGLASGAANDFPVNVQALFAVGIRKHARRPRAISGVHVIAPQIDWLKNVPIGIDHFVVTPHNACLLIVTNKPLRSKRLVS